MTMYSAIGPSSKSQILRRADIYEARHQAMLREVSLERVSLRCLCKGLPGAQMGINRGPRGLHPRRAQGSAAGHAHGCPHSDVPNLSAALGAPPGSFSEINGQILVNFDVLFPPTDPGARGGSGGSWTGTNHDAMLSLTWMLVQRAGLNMAHPLATPQDPFHHLLSAASEIEIKSGQRRRGLDSMLLVPTRDIQSNYMKLRQLPVGNPLVLASLLPVASSVQGDSISLKPMLGPTATIWQGSLNQALKKYARAAVRWRQGGEVLVIAIAEAATVANDADRRSAFAKIQRIALLPVTRSLTPLPTVEVEERYIEAQRAPNVFVVVPEEDPMTTKNRLPML